MDNIYQHVNDRNGLINTLVEAATKLNISVDVSKLSEQDYLNFLHKVYEEGYNRGSNIWLDFHEMIHALEFNKSTARPRNEIFINYRDKAGPLEKPFDKRNLKYATQKIPKGTCYTTWSELGKTLDTYWSSHEPDNIQRLCQLAKPWLILRPSFRVALEDVDLSLSPENKEKFTEWFKQYEEQWKKHWKVDDWTLDEIISITSIPIGVMNEVDVFTEKMKDNRIPTRIISE